MAKKKKNGYGKGLPNNNALKAPVKEATTNAATEEVLPEKTSSVIVNGNGGLIRNDKGDAVQKDVATDIKGSVSTEEKEESEETLKSEPNGETISTGKEAKTTHGSPKDNMEGSQSGRRTSAVEEALVAIALKKEKTQTNGKPNDKASDKTDCKMNGDKNGNAHGAANDNKDEMTDDKTATKLNGKVNEKANGMGEKTNNAKDKVNGKANGTFAEANGKNGNLRKQPETVPSMKTASEEEDKIAKKVEKANGEKEEKEDGRKSNTTNGDTNKGRKEGQKNASNGLANGHFKTSGNGSNGLPSDGIASNGRNGRAKSSEATWSTTSKESSGTTTPADFLGGTCINCDKSTVRTCGGCVDAPIYVDDKQRAETVAETFYCSAECQRKDWARHKIECQKLQARKSLQRAGTILKSALERIRNRAPSVSNTEAADDQKAAFLGRTSEEAIVCLSTLTRGLLEGLLSSIVEVCITKTRPKYGPGSESTQPTTTTHGVYKVTLKCDNTAWALDPSLAPGQKHTKCLSPWSEYIRRQLVSDGHLEECELGRARAKWEKEKTQSKDRGSSQALRFILALDKYLNEDAFKETGRKLNELLKASPGEIEAFLGGLESVTMEPDKDPQPAATTAEANTGNDKDAVAGGGQTKTSTNSPKEETPEEPSPAPSLPVSSSAWYTFEEIPGKGVGVVAAKHIPTGTRILAEAPIFTIPREEYDKAAAERVVNRRVGRLSPEQRARFFALSNSYAGSSDRPQCGRAMGITRTNALPLGDDDAASEGGLFLEAARFNHACRHNAQNTWNPRLGMVTIHVLAAHGLQPGDEITLSYLARTENTARRQACLQSSFGFACHCPGLCALPAAAAEKEAQDERAAASDRRLDRIVELEDALGGGDGLRMHATPLACLRDVQELLDLLRRDDGGQDARTPRAYYGAFQTAITHSDEARARVFAQRAYERYVVLQGEDGPATETMKGYADRPSRHSLYGTTRQWRQGVDKVPRGVTAQELEDWLWRRRSY